ncbi:hypothetical protein Desdi_2353 [Desulfitobacterium dichloroeliminans LMG P-21439]|uniref:Uncharacterized protein n=1 Tax=Desulfitobacterium dichloroeliminans (strain LMG P-21439 / DCA1) TaxID=871963 RepID=L0F992_DESDL|nr:hypothetical protein [Desulfitobacterium dichloroeliminans]AGA69777.1 hypothetical protein Desdi_2353 [Desulfitobacterium dichloroeliminans LMG P-21439]
MRRLSFFSRNKKRGRINTRSWGRVSSNIGSRKSSSFGFQKLEQVIVRAVVLLTVLLVVVQMGLGLAKDPVDYYISIAQDVEAPSISSTPVSSTITPDLILETVPHTSQITLKAVPAAPVRVIQNGKVLGTLARGELAISAQTGTLQLDGTNVSAIVRVQVIQKAPEFVDPRLNQVVIVERNIQTLRVGR